MRKIIINEMRLENFRNLSRERLVFGREKNFLKGPSGSGKSTVLEAFCWLLYGKNSSRSTQCEVRPMQEDGSLRDPLALTQVFASLQIVREEGEEMLWLRRCLRQTSDGSLTTDFYVNTFPCRKSDFEELVEDLIPQWQFYLQLDPEAFLDSLSQWETLQLFLTLFREDMVESPTGALKELMEDRDIAEFMNLLRKKKAEQQKTFNDLPFRISEMEGTLRQLGTPDFEAMKRRETCLNQEKTRLLKTAPAGRLHRIDEQLREIHLVLGRETFQKSCADRLCKLRAQQAMILKNLGDLRKGEELVRDYGIKMGRELKQAFAKRLPDSPLALHVSGQGSCSLTFHGVPLKQLCPVERAQAAEDFSRLVGSAEGRILPSFCRHIPGRNAEGPGQQILLKRTRSGQLEVESPWR